jgi:dipeptidyl aminopeptidase/acylaminoacyl peptidase
MPKPVRPPARPVARFALSARPMAGFALSACLMAGSALSAAPAGALGQASAQAAEKAPKGFSVHDMLAMDRIQEFRPSPNGAEVAYTLSVTDLDANRRRSSIWLVRMDGRQRRITPEGMSAHSPRWGRDNSVYFISDKSGSAQVWKIDPNGGLLPTQVTDLPLPVDSMETCPQGDIILVSMAVFPNRPLEETLKIYEAHAKRKSTGMHYDRLFVRRWDTWEDHSRNHIFRVSLRTGDARDLMQGLEGDAPTKPFGGSEEYAISPDGRTLVFTAKVEGGQEAWSANLDLWEVPVDGSAAPVRITANPAVDTNPAFSPDGKSLAYLAMARPGYEADRQDLVIRDVATKRERRIVVRAHAGEDGDRSVGEFTWGADGKEIFCTAEHLGQVAIFAVDVARGTARIVHADGTVSAPRALPDGRLVFGLDSLASPRELFTVQADGKGLRPLTRINEARLAEAGLGTFEQFTFTGAKGDKVHGYIVRPAGFDPSLKYPVAFLIHGGPQGSFGNHFHYRWNPQAYAGAGYAVVMVDFHGSTGYGQAFTDAINGDWGGAPFEDLMKGLGAAVEKYPFLDGERVGALGASYGGYMINWIAGQAPDRFRALVCHDGNLDERMAYFDTEELWFPEWEHGGTPWDSPAGYAKHNPIDHVDKWKTPTLVIHGSRDYRVVETQGLSTFTALQRRGVPSRLLIFPDENHWVLKPANSIQWHRTVMAWLDRWVKGGAKDEAKYDAKGGGQPTAGGGPFEGAPRVPASVPASQAGSGAAKLDQKGSD